LVFSKIIINLTLVRFSIFNLSCLQMIKNRKIRVDIASGADGDQEQGAGGMGRGRGRPSRNDEEREDRTPSDWRNAPREGPPPGQDRGGGGFRGGDRGGDRMERGKLDFINYFPIYVFKCPVRNQNLLASGTRLRSIQEIAHPAQDLHPKEVHLVREEMDLQVLSAAETVHQAQDSVVVIEMVLHLLVDVIETARHHLEVETEKVDHLLVVIEMVRLHSVAVVTVLHSVEIEKEAHHMVVTETVPRLLVVIEMVPRSTVMRCSEVNVQALEVIFHFPFYIEN
jgi:hypothetical protein